MNLFRRQRFCLLLLTLFCTSASAELLSGEAWLDHVRHDLAPFWYKAAAGVKEGSFASYLCNDASVPDHQALVSKSSSLCPELASAPDWVQEGFPYQWTRMVSRQTYAYGVIYHLTGDPRALELARQGVAFLRHRALLADGDVVGKFSQGKVADKADERTSQDLAYAELGMAFYYYLTRDGAVLADIQKIHHHLFATYKDPVAERLTWYPARRQSGQQIELVSQLDPLNAYMVLLSPILPKAQQGPWREQMGWLADSIVRDFYFPEEQRFFGYIHDESGRSPDARHADFGHTIKSFWMLYLVARERNDWRLRQFAEGGMYNILKRAYREDQLKNLPLPGPVDEETGRQMVGWWGDGDGKDGSAWWEYAELDQAAATLGLSSIRTRHYLEKSWPSWFDSFVDKQHGEVWGWIASPGEAKVHLWKNGYHTLEHALIGYLAAQSFGHKPVTLYFAYPVPTGKEQPVYYYRGEIIERHATGRSPSGLPLYRVTARELH